MTKEDERDAFRNCVRDAKKPKFWIAKDEGDMITGRVVAFRSITSRFGDGEVMVIKNDEDHEDYSVFLSSVIKTARETQEIKVGERVGIKYLGEVQGESAEYKDYIVQVDRDKKKELDK